MSALTDLFTAMANKIRSKTGTATTYTPSEMVSDGIDDVYDAGVASATTPITPSNSSPASMTANTGYKPTANGYAISSYSSITPSDSSPVSLSSGSIYKMGGNGHAIASYTTVIPSGTPTHINAESIVKTSVYGGDIVSAIYSEYPSNSNPTPLTSGSNYHAEDNGYFIESYSSVTPSSTQTAVSSGDIVKIGGSGVIVDSVPTPTSLTPSNSSPATITSGTLYSATANGKAVASVTDVTPSDSTPPSISSGDIIKSSASGYLYATQQSGGMTQTTLWTNPSVNSDFPMQTITLSQNITDFDYIGIYYRGRRQQGSIDTELLVTPTNLAKSKSTANYPLITIGGFYSTSPWVRVVNYSAANKLMITDAKVYGSSTTNNEMAFPLYVYGYKL